MSPMTRRTAIYLLVACALSLGVAARITSADKTRKGKANVCVANKPCADCSGVDACQRTCEGGGCAFKHSGMGSAHFYCPDGKCTLDHSGSGQGVLHCAGGGCKAICTGSGQCQVVECKRGCSVDCKGTGQCSSSKARVEPDERSAH